MSTFRDFEVLYENIPHLSKCLTINQAMAVLMVESFPFTKEEKFHVSVVVCKLEFIRSKRKYNDELGLKMYEIICDIFTENSQYENFLLLGTHLDQFISSVHLFMTVADYNHIAPTVAKYFSFPPTGYKKELQCKLNLVPKKHGSVYHQNTPIVTTRKQKKGFLRFGR